MYKYIYTYYGANDKGERLELFRDRGGKGPHLPTYLPTAQNTPTTDTPTKHTKEQAVHQ